jgi:hypothetical protein
MKTAEWIAIAAIITTLAVATFLEQLKQLGSTICSAVGC